MKYLFKGMALTLLLIALNTVVVFLVAQLFSIIGIMELGSTQTLWLLSLSFVIATYLTVTNLVTGVVKEWIIQSRFW